jgi:transposase
VSEIDCSRHIGKRRAGKSDPIDAVRAARELLARPAPAQMRADGDREALRLLMIDRDNAVQSAKTARTALAAILVTAEHGLGYLSAAQILLSWSHAGRIRSEQAFAMLSGTAPVPVSSGRTDRHRLNRLGDRQLNRAIHTIAVTRMRCHQPTQAYVQRRQAEGKTDREIRRCIKRYLARHLYRTLTNGSPSHT